MILRIEPEPSDPPSSQPMTVAGLHSFAATGVYMHPVLGKQTFRYLIIGDRSELIGRLAEAMHAVHDYRTNDYATRSSDTSGGPSETAPD